MNQNKFGVLATPVLFESQLSFRIGLARKRTTLYPLDSMDFIMMDLERPEMCSRHAHWCTEDLTGRLLEFLSCAEGIDGKCDPRLPELFERILKQRRRSGIFGRYAGSPTTKGLPEDCPNSGIGRLFPGLLRYYDITGDQRALEAAVGIAERIISVKDAWSKQVKSYSANGIETWITEHFARLYNITQEPRYLDFCDFVNEHIVTCMYSHAHGFMSAMRGLQLAAIYSGNKSWNEKPEFYRRKIIEEHYEMPDGCVGEAFPRNFRNEGCAIADWLMMNLNAGYISGDDTAYDKAERILWNALFFNQFVTGGFGHRDLSANGYGMTGLSEAWWCCTHHAGMAMTEYARHAVTFQNNTVRINLLVPGKFRLSAPGAGMISVEVKTSYPASADTIIEINNLPADAKVKIRIPDSVSAPVLSETRDKTTARLTLRGKLGHRIEPCQGGVMLKYGPLVLSSYVHYWNNEHKKSVVGSVPAGYIPAFLPGGMPILLVDGKKDTEGRLKLDHQPLPDWSYFDEGPGARCCVGQAAVNVPVRFENGAVMNLRFWPLCYSTSNLSCYEAPIVFPGTGT